MNADPIQAVIVTNDTSQATSQSFSFPIGHRELHPDVSINFQPNRFYGWVGDNSTLTEMRAAVAGVSDYPPFTRIILDLGERALALHEVLKGAFYLCLAEDHYIPVHQFTDQIATLTHVRSLTARLFTRVEQAQNHVQVGYMGLAIRTLIDWMEALGRFESSPKFHPHSVFCS